VAQPLPAPALEYARRLYANVLAWYESAERKAQIVLTVDGVFLGLLTASFTSSVEDLRGVVDAFGPLTWISLGVALVMLLASLLSAVWCLRSRQVYGPASENPAETMWFFRMIAAKQQAEFMKQARAVDEVTEVDALTSQIWRLSQIVAVKHKWANLAFGATGLSLFMFTLAAASYVGVDLGA
jgi:Family of unknown function (DUF5706)